MTFVREKSGVPAKFPLPLGPWHVPQYWPYSFAPFWVSAACVHVAQSAVEINAAEIRLVLIIENLSQPLEDF